MCAVGRREERLSYQHHVLTQLAVEGLASGRSLLMAHVNPTQAGAMETSKCLQFVSRIRGSTFGTVPL
jgi:hypothetical protein